MRLILLFFLLNSYSTFSQNWDWADRAGSSSTNTYPFSATVDDQHKVYWGGTMRGDDVTIGNDTINVGFSDDGIIVKYDSLGNVQWYKHFDNGGSFDMAVEDLIYHDGHIYACGWFAGTANFDTLSLSTGTGTDAFLIKLDTLGNIIWVKQGGAPSVLDRANGIAVDEDGFVYITGTCNHYLATPWSTPVLATFGSVTIPFGFNEFYVVKYDVNGNAIWGVGSTGPQSDERGTDITSDKNGGIYIVGEYEDDINFGSNQLIGNLLGWKSFYISRLTTNGNISWVRTLNCDRETKGVAVDADTLGNIFVSSTVDGTYYGFQDTLILSNGIRYFNLNFDTLGNNIAEELSPFRGRDLEADNRGNMYLFGNTNNADNRMGKFGSDVQQKWFDNGINGQSDYGLTGTFDPNSNHVYFAGYFFGTQQFGSTLLTAQGNNDMFIAQYEDNIIDGTLSISNPTCSNSCDAVASVVPFKGNPPYSFQWSNGSLSDSAFNLCAGQHSVVITDSNLDNIVLNFEIAPLDNIDTTLQVNDLELTATSGYQYQWFQDGAVIAGATNNPFVADTNGTYQVQISDTNGCTVFSEEIVFNYNCDSVDFAISGITICQNDTLFGTVSHELSSAQFIWTVASDTIIGSSLVWPATSPGAQNVSISVGTGLCTVDTSFIVNVNPIIETSDTLTICQGDSILIHGSYELAAGTYIEVYPSVLGCDSTSVIVLQLYPTYQTTDVIQSCSPITWIDGVTYSSSNNSASYVTSTSLGCDSTIFLDLTISSSTSSIDTHIACDSFTWIDGNTYTNSNNTATYTTTNINGCDSIVTLDLTINYSTNSTDTHFACDNFTWVDGNTYITSNTSATHVLTTTAGCDSVVTLNLTIFQSNSSTEVISACNSFTWIDGNTYTASNNTAQWTLTNSNGCDSIISLDLTILTVNTSITENDPQLIASTGATSYQWLDCMDGFAPISGETLHLFTAPYNGEFAVQIEENGCIDTSACYEIATIGFETFTLHDLHLYPNPSQGSFIIDSKFPLNPADIRIINTLGQEVESFTDSENGVCIVYYSEEPGIYYLSVKGVGTYPIVKL